MLAKIFLNIGREKSVIRHHPWIYSKAIKSYESNIKNGDLVEIYDHEHNYLATGFFNANSQITVRIISFSQQDIIDKDFIKNRIQMALAKRVHLIEQGNDAIRVVASEGDLMPGLTIDKYNNYIVFSISSSGMDRLKDYIIQSLKEIFADHIIYEKSDTISRKKEGLQSFCKLHVGDEIEDIIYVKENNEILLPINIKTGHKTGGYLDQRHSRKVCKELSYKKKVLNCFSYTGGFSLWALKGGASKIENVDISQIALSIAKEGVVKNHLDPGRCKFIKSDVFEYLREQIQKNEKYDLIILDPPKFVDNIRNLAKGCRGYQDINRLAFKLLNDNGTLMTFSCSGLVDLNLFQKIVADAAIEAGVDAFLLDTLRQDEDHLISLACPESFYLKGLVVKINKGVNNA